MIDNFCFNLQFEIRICIYMLDITHSYNYNQNYIPDSMHAWTTHLYFVASRKMGMLQIYYEVTSHPKVAFLKCSF